MSPMPTDRKVLVLLERDEAKALCLGPSEYPYSGTRHRSSARAKLRSALDKEGTQREEWGRPVYFESEEIARRALSALFNEAASREHRNHRIRRRTITTFEDGSEYRTAWRDIDLTKEDQ